MGPASARLLGQLAATMGTGGGGQLLPHSSRGLEGCVCVCECVCVCVCVCLSECLYFSKGAWPSNIHECFVLIDLTSCYDQCSAC